MPQQTPRIIEARRAANRWENVPGGRWPVNYSDDNPHVAALTAAELDAEKKGRN